MRPLAIGIFFCALFGFLTPARSQSTGLNWVGSTQHWTINADGTQTEMAVSPAPGLTSLWGRLKAGSTYNVDVDVTQTQVDSGLFGVRLELNGVEGGAFEVVLLSVNATGPLGTMLYLRKIPGAEIVASAPVQISIGTPSHWSIAASDGRVQITHDGAPAIDYSDASTTFTGRVGPVSYTTRCRMSSWSWSQPAVTWAGTSEWDLSDAGIHPEIAASAAHAYLWKQTGFGADFTTEVKIKQLAAGGELFGLQFEGVGGTVYEVVMQASPDPSTGERRLLARRLVGGAPVILAYGPALTQAVGTATAWRAVATSDRLRVFADGALALDLPGIGDFTGRVGPVAYATNARFDFDTGGWDRPSSAFDCQDVRTADGEPWWFPGASSASLPLRIRDASITSRSFDLTSTVRHGTTTTSTGTQSFTPPPRAWTPAYASVALGTDDLYWVELSNASISHSHGEWPVARHTMPAPNTFSATDFALGVWYRDFGLRDQTARNTYAHALGRACVRDSINAIYGLEPKDSVELDILDSYGVKAVIVPPSNASLELLNHNAVLAYQISDKPDTQQEIDEIRASCDFYKGLGATRPCVTAMNAEKSPELDFHKWWRDLGSEVRAFSYFPYRNTTYDTLVTDATYRRHMGGPSTMDWMNAGLSTPWYFIAQAHGNTSSTSDPVLRLPAPRQVMGQIRLAVIHGAKGVFAYSYTEDNPDYLPLVDHRTLLDISPGQLAYMRGTYAQLPNWWSRGILGQSSQPVRRADTELPYSIHTRQLSSGTIALLNLDIYSHYVSLTTSPDLSQDTAYGNSGGVQWGGNLDLQGGAIAFAQTSDPAAWRPDTTSDYQYMCQALVDSVTPVQGDFPDRIVLDPIAPYQATTAQWSTTITKGVHAGDGMLSPLALLRLTDGRHPDSWTLQVNTALTSPLSADAWRTAQVAYAHGARDVQDNNGDSIAFGPYTAANTPPANQAMTDLITSGTLGGEFRGIGAANVHLLTVGRVYNGKQYVVLVNLATYNVGVELASQIPATQALDVYAGTTETVTPQANGLYSIASVIVPANSIKVLEWMCTDGCSVCGDGVVSGQEQCDPELDRGCRSDCTGPILTADTELSCRDAADNDGDGLVDCTDIEDCATSLDCWTTPGTCEGLDCGGGGSGGSVCGDGVVSGNEECDPGLDVGCLLDCTGFITNAVTEISCTDGVDNDGDGLIDCTDVVDCNLNAACRANEGELCTLDFDCENGLICASGSCRQPHCENGIKDADEDGTDCGGPCVPCTGRQCQHACRPDADAAPPALDALPFSSGTFSRPSSATSELPGGGLQNTRPNELRWVYVEGQRLALFEGAATNVLAWSQSLDHSPEWSVPASAQMSVMPDISTDPLGTQTADLLSSPDGPSSSPAQTVPLPAEDSVLSFWIGQPVDTTNQSYQEARIFATTGGSTATANWQVYPGWNRSDLQVPGAQGTSAAIWFSDVAGVPTSEIEAHSSQDFLAWGAQLESQAFPTSYIPTQGGPASRAADVLTFESIPAWVTSGHWQLDFAPLFASDEMRTDWRYTLVSFGATTDIALVAGTAGTATLVVRYPGGVFNSPDLSFDRNAALTLTLDLAGNSLTIDGEATGTGTYSVPSLSFNGSNMRVGGAMGGQSEAFAAISELRQVATTTASCTADAACTCGNGVLDPGEDCDPGLDAHCGWECSTTDIVTCQSDGDCPGGSVCGIDNGPNFGLDLGTRVCWPAPTCLGTGALLNCGPTSPCGDCICVPDCSQASCGGDSSDGCGGVCRAVCGDNQPGCVLDEDCQPGYTCGEGQAGAFGWGVGANVCWPAICEDPLQRRKRCGTPGAECGDTCPDFPSECGAQECGTDRNGNSCGACSDGFFCDASSHCTLVEDFTLPPPPLTTVADVLDDPPADPFGTLPGNFAVDANGAATYTIPLEVPPGPAGHAPKLALRYASTSGDGFVGKGWSLSGLSAITRCSRTFAQHGYARGVELSSDDALCLDGKLLVKVDASETTGSITYRTELDSFVTVFSVGNQWTSDGDGDWYTGPSSFAVVTKDGTTLSYGATSNARVEANFGSATTNEQYTVHVAWLLDAAVDRNGNAIAVKYEDNPQRNLNGFKFRGEVRPLEITYAKNSTFKVAFEYDDDVGECAIRSFRGGVGRYFSSPIKTITTSLNDGTRETPVRVYRLENELRGSDWLLKSVAACAPHSSGERCLPPTVFTYSPLDTSGLTHLANTTDSAGHIPIDPNYANRVFSRWEPENLNNFSSVSFDYDLNGRHDILHTRFEGRGKYLKNKPVFKEDEGAPEFERDRTIYYPRLSHPLDSSGSAFSAGTSDADKFDCSFSSLADFNGDGAADGYGLCLLPALGPQQAPSWYPVVTIAGHQTNSLAGAIYASSGATYFMEDSDGVSHIERSMALDIEGDGMADILFCPEASDPSEHSLVLYKHGDWSTSATSDPQLLIVPNFVPDAQVSLDGVGSAGPELNCENRIIVDYDGDGIEDVLLAEYDRGGHYVSGHRPHLFAVAYEDRGSGSELLLKDIGESPLGQAGALENYALLDVNGDGFTDLVTPNSDGVPELFLSTGRGFEYAAIAPADGHYRQFRHGFVVDVNSDGRQELLIPSQEEGWAVHFPYAVSGPSGHEWIVRTSDMTYWLASAKKKFHDRYYAYGYQAPHVLDWDGDGVAEVVGRRPPANDTSDWTHPVFELWKAAPRTQSLLSSVVDGVGKQISVSYESSGSAYTPGTCAYPQKCLTTLPHPVVSSHTVYGASGSYRDPRNLSQGYITKTFEYTYDDARVDLRGRGWLGFRKRAVREFADAGQLVKATSFVYDLDTDSAEYAIFPYAGYPVVVQTEKFTNLSNALIQRSAVSNNWGLRTASSGRPYLALERRTVLELEDAGGVTNQFVGAREDDFDYDEYGNRTLLVSAWADGRSETVSTTYLASDDPSFEKYSARGLVGLVRTQTVSGTSSVSGAASKSYQIELAYENDAGFRGLPSSVKRWSMAGGAAVAVEQTTALTYDAHGNEIARLLSGREATTQAYTTVYDSNGIAPVEYRNSLHHDREMPSTKMGIDLRTGLAQWVVRPDGSWTVVNRDAFGREVTSFDSVGTSSTTHYRSGGVLGGAFTRAVSAEGKPEVETEYNALGLLIATRTTDWAPQVNASLTRITEVGYDTRGRKVASGSSHFEGTPTPSAQYFYYDDADRLRQVSVPWVDADGNMEYVDTLHSYATLLVPSPGNDWGTDWTQIPSGVRAHRSEEVAAEGRTSTEISDMHGNVVGAIDAFGTTTVHVFGALDCLRTTGVSGDGRVITTTYDTDDLGRVVGVTDPDVGAMGYTYDGLGLLSSHTRGASTTRYQYDALGRKEKVTSADGVYTFAYDGDGLDETFVGHLQSESVDSGNVVSTTDYEYHNPGAKVSAIHRTVSGEPSPFHTYIEPDELGRIGVVRYPSPVDRSLAVRFHYEESYGRLDSVIEDGTGHALWSLLEVDGSGNGTRVLYANGFRASRSYQAATGRLEETSVQRPDGSNFLTVALAYDARGFLRKRSTTTDDQSASSEVFEHDALGRLRSRTVADHSEELYAYDAFGNLTLSPRTGVLHYDAPQPHQVTSTDDGRTFSYEGGNQTVREGTAFLGGEQRIRYTDFGLPAEVTSGPEASADPSAPVPPPLRQTFFSYDAGNRRIAETTLDRSDSSEVDTSFVYVGDLYRRKTTSSGATGTEIEHTARIPTPDGLVIEATLNSGLSDHEFRFLQTDYLGSVLSVADQDGSRIASTAYSPFGEAEAPIDSWGGFAGHEGDAEIGLINMRGRIYDPHLGRFLSPDPIVPNPLSSQSWNRYSYVSNSPLNAIDPSGFEEDWGIGYSYGTEPISIESIGSWVEEPIGVSVTSAGSDPFAAEDSVSINGGAGYVREEIESPVFGTRAQSDSVGFPDEAEFRTTSSRLTRTLAERYGTCTACHIPRYIEWLTGEAATPNDIPWKTLDAQASWSGSVVSLGTLALVAVGIAGEMAGALRGAQGTTNTLFHYTNETGHTGILESETLNPSLKSLNPKDVRYGNGQYLSDIVPGTKTPAQLSREFLGMPFQGARFTHYLEIDVSGLNVVRGRPGVFVVPNELPLDLAGRIVGSGPLP